MALNTVQLGTSATTIYENTTGRNVKVMSINFCNTDSATKTITIYAYPSGGSASDATTLYKNLSIPATDTLEKELGNFMLADDDIIVGIADVADKVTVIISTFEL